MLRQLAIGTFSSYQAAEIALVELKNQGFLMDQVSIVGRDINSRTETTGAKTNNRLVSVGNLHTHENRTEEAAKDGAIAGSSLGGLTGLLVGLGILAIPGIGPVMLAGAAATAIASTISGSVIGAITGSLVGGLVGLGIPEDRAQVYSDRIADGDYLVMVEGSKKDIAIAESIFSHRGIAEWYVYDLSSKSLETVTTPHLRV
jgi:uncharacterized protein YcfJ